MGNRSSAEEDSITVSMNIEGEFEDVMGKLQPKDDSNGNVDLVARDFSILIDTVVRIEGGTRSAIADQLPEEMSIEYDSQAVVDALHILERYELVVLEGNTWKPGPKAHSIASSS